MKYRLDAATLLLCFSIFLIAPISKCHSQKTLPSYSELIRQGWKLCLNKEYTTAAKYYEEALNLQKNAPLRDRYNAVCINALANNKDAAYRHLFVVVNDLKWYDTKHLKNDTDLINLRDDPRWMEVLNIMAQNKQKIEQNFDPTMVGLLDSIYFDDQQSRSQIRSMEEQYGRGSKEMDEFWKSILRKDSINLIKVSRILDSQGWPSKEKIGERGASTLFLVVQHANLATQQKYLNLVTQAMQKGDLSKKQYAMFYDRLALRTGKKQMYGTQLAMDKDSNKPYILPLEDPRHVDKRRKAMGLNSMQDNLNRWDITWDVDAYIQLLPSLVAKERELDKQVKKNK